jgi:flagellar FliJ protein
VTAFRFRLDRVLRLREGQERQRAADLGRALAAERRRLDELADAERGLEDARDGSDAAPETPSPAGTLHVRSQALQAAADRVSDASERAQEAAARSDEERENLRIARRARESLERLKDHRVEIWKTEESRQEQKDIDEIARRRREDGEER